MSWKTVAILRMLDQRINTSSSISAPEEEWEHARASTLVPGHPQHRYLQQPAWQQPRQPERLLRNTTEWNIHRVGRRCHIPRHRGWVSGAGTSRQRLALLWIRKSGLSKFEGSLVYRANSKLVRAQHSEILSHKETKWAGEIPQVLKALVALAQNSSSIPSTHVAAHIYL